MASRGAKLKFSLDCIKAAPIFPCYGVKPSSLTEACDHSGSGVGGDVNSRGVLLP